MRILCFACCAPALWRRAGLLRLPRCPPLGVGGCGWVGGGDERAGVSCGAAIHKPLAYRCGTVSYTQKPYGPSPFGHQSAAHNPPTPPPVGRAGRPGFCARLGVLVAAHAHTHTHQDKDTGRKLAVRLSTSPQQHRPISPSLATTSSQSTSTPARCRASGTNKGLVRNWTARRVAPAAPKTLIPFSNQKNPRHERRNHAPFPVGLTLSSIHHRAAPALIPGTLIRPRT